jgi:hypothetical protein
MNDDDKETRTNIHALIGIRTQGLSVDAIETYASERAATGTGFFLVLLTFRGLYIFICDTPLGTVFCFDFRTVIIYYRMD